ncbi:MAG: hypothetical protein NVS1B4_17890 [Gemmatimonadaceae bacterium]
MTRRGRVAIGVLAVWAAGVAMLVRREFFHPTAERMLEAALRVSPGTLFYTVAQNGRQIGFASSLVDTGQQRIQVRDYVVADLPVGGKLHRAEARTDASLDRALRVTSFTVGLTTEAGAITADGQVYGDTLLRLTVHSGAGAKPDTQRIRLTGPIVLPTVVPLAIVLGERPTIGKRYTLSVFDPIALAQRDAHVSVRAESLFVLSDSATLDSATHRWSPVHPDTVRAWQIALDGATGFTGWVDEAGRIVDAVQAGQLTLHRAPYEIAFENWRLDEVRAAGRVTADRDILETTAIAARAPLGTGGLDLLRVRLGRVNLRGFDLGGGRQKLANDTLTVVREKGADLAASYTLPDGARGRFPALVSPEPLIQSEDLRIVGMAARIIGHRTDPRVAAERLTRWVHDSVEKRITAGVPSAVQVLQSRRGDCNEHTHLFVALARSAGIPARVAAGLAYVNGKFYYHAWPEVYLSDWVAVDPTFGQFPADAAHLRFVVGGLHRQAELLRLIGSLQIDVLR